MLIIERGIDVEEVIDLSKLSVRLHLSYDIGIK